MAHLMRIFPPMVFLWAILVALMMISISVVVAWEAEDLYELLGVSKTATVKEIKSAYRKKALLTHPDKQPDIPPEEAAEGFQKIVNAFEILSDERTRRNYDMRKNSQGGRSSQQQHYHQQQWRRRQQQSNQQSRFGNDYKQRLKVREAQSRVMHISSLAQLKAFMLDEDELLERNLLICFCTRGAVEDIVMKNMVYPYPFAGMSDGGVWFETILQTTLVIFDEPNELTEYFNIPNAESMRKSTGPIFIFGRRGEPLVSHRLKKLQTQNRDQFENWVWTNLETKITITNKHPFTVECFWVHGERARKQFQLAPEESVEVTTMLSHEWWFRDYRVDRRPHSPKQRKLANDCVVAIFTVQSDEQTEYTIEPKQCFDMSGHCHDWKKHGGCFNNRIHSKEFMQAECPFSCHMCSDEHDSFRISGILHDEF